MQIHFISGLPRSGSTLLCNLLAQNPRFRVSGTSGLCDMLVRVRNQWDEVAENRAMPPEESLKGKIAFMRGAFHGFFRPFNGQVCFDKNRLWPAYFEMIEAVLVPPPAKMIVTIRDFREVVASLERIWREVSRTRQIPAERAQPNIFKTLPGRLAEWTKADGMIGMAVNSLFDAVRRGYRDRMHFMVYEEWTKLPLTAMRGLHEFLEIPDDFEYDFDNVEPVIVEDDTAYDFPGLHHIRPRIEPPEPKWRETLGDFGRAFDAIQSDLLKMIRPREPEPVDASSASPVAERDSLPPVSHRNNKVPETQKA